MLTIVEYPKGRYTISFSETDQTITGLCRHELNALRQSIEAIEVQDMPEPPIFKEPNTHVEEPFRSIINKFKNEN